MTVFQKRFKILIVEDSAIHRMLTHKMINCIAPNAELIECNNGIEAIRLFQSKRPDIILMDVHLPGLNGWETSKEIRLLMEGDKVPIIALTAATMNNEMSVSLAAGMNDFLSKPVTPDDLLHVLIKWL